MADSPISRNFEPRWQSLLIGIKWPLIESNGVLRGDGVDTRPVLIVEDDSTIAVLMEWALAAEGHRVVVAGDADAALAAARSDPPSLILMDMNLPFTSGSELLRALKESYVTAPIIAVTADPRAAEVAMQGGVSDTLLKPFDLDDLLSVVARYTGQTYV